MGFGAVYSGGCGFFERDVRKRGVGFCAGCSGGSWVYRAGYKKAGVGFHAGYKRFSLAGDGF